MRRIFERAFRAAFFDKKAFEQAYWDDNATADGVIVVASVAVVSVVVSVVSALSLGPNVLLELFGAAVGAVASWLITAALTWVAATKILKTGGGIQTMMALHGLAFLPLALGTLPFEFIGLIALVWYLAVLVIATKIATDTSTKNALLSVIIGYALVVLFSRLFAFPMTAVSALGALF